MRVLFIGGNGNISWYCVEYALAKGYEVWELNRGESLKTRRDIQNEVKVIHGDMRDPQSIREILADKEFDVVCDFICYNAVHAKIDIDLFKDKVKQFIVISSAAVYKREEIFIPFTEDMPHNIPEVSSSYIAGKVEMERVFWKEHELNNFPITILRPGYTYDTILPVSIGHNCYTAIQKIIDGKPLLIAGKGNNLWSFTHAEDFAKAFVELLGNSKTIGQAYNISTDEWITWKEASAILLKLLGREESGMIHVSDERALELKDFQPRDMMRERIENNVHNTEKIRKLIPNWKCTVSLEEGMKRTLGWLNEKEIRKRIVPRYEKMLESLYRELGY